MASNLSESPQISIIIPVHNGAATISVCLQSILDSSFKDYEIIVVNDGSTDKSVEYMKENFPQVLLSVKTGICSKDQRSELFDCDDIQAETKSFKD